MSIAVADADISEVAFRLAMIEPLDISFAPDAEVMIRATFMSKRSADWNVTWPAQSAENKFVGRHLNFKLASLVAGLDAASNIPLRSLNLRFQKRLRMDSVLGTVDPQDFINQAFSVEGDIELNLKIKHTET